MSSASAYVFGGFASGRLGYISITTQDGPACGLACSWINPPASEPSRTAVAESKGDASGELEKSTLGKGKPKQREGGLHKHTGCSLYVQFGQGSPGNYLPASPQRHGTKN